MPDNIGMPTNEEITHYTNVLHESKMVLNKLKEKSFNRQEFDEAHKTLEDVYKSFNNPYFFANSTGHSALWDFPNALKNVADSGIREDSLARIEEEIKRAVNDLETLRKARENNPMNRVLSHILNKRS